MRHIGATALAAIALCGCATDNNTLIFGTSTTFGLDASAAATEGGSPHVTVGYKRAEGVWMPLRQVPALKAADGSYDSVNGIYQSINSETGKAERKDAYSVFASIGAKFNTGASASQVQAGAGLAQFFATGAAAVNVSQNEALVTALKVSDPQSSEAQAKAVAAVTSGGLDEAIGKLPADVQANIKAKAAESSQAEVVKLTGLVGCVGTNETKWKNTVAKAKTDHPEIVSSSVETELLKQDSPSKRLLWLSDASVIVAPLATACPTASET